VNSILEAATESPTSEAVGAFLAMHHARIVDRAAHDAAKARGIYDRALERYPSNKNLWLAAIDFELDQSGRRISEAEEASDAVGFARVVALYQRATGDASLLPEDDKLELWQNYLETVHAFAPRVDMYALFLLLEPVFWPILFVAHVLMVVACCWLALVCARRRTRSSRRSRRARSRARRGGTTRRPTPAHTRSCRVPPPFFRRQSDPCPLLLLPHLTYAVLFSVSLSLQFISVSNVVDAVRWLWLIKCRVCVCGA
jgi:hypothetical protein